MNIRLVGYIVFIIFFHFSLNAQNNFTQTIKGRIIDKLTQQPIPDASVIVSDLNPVVGTTSDLKGYFSMQNIPVGRHNIKISFLGYKELNYSQIELVSGKELVLNVQMEESVITSSEAVVKANKSKNSSINEMSLIGTKTFSVEEVNKYAGSWGDPSRMVSNYAGVVAVSDMRNDIVVRGNSPIGLQWRLNGVEIHNPNHYAVSGSSGGGISMINNNLLDNSDFMTGAFSAEYGNAYSAIFDLKMRNGNSEKREHIFQFGVNGFELGTEGPFSKKGKSSYLINYRYSTLAILDKFGISIIDAIPKFQDLSFNFNLPIKSGNISMFGIGGKSDAEIHAIQDSSRWEKKSDRYGGNHGSKMAVIGLVYTKYIFVNSYWRTSVCSSFGSPFDIVDSIGNDFTKNEIYKMNNSENRNSISSFINSRLNKKNKIRLGVILNQINVNNSVNSLGVSKSMSGKFAYSQEYVQLKHDFNDKLSVNTGIHSIYLFENKNITIEPRISINWNISNIQSLGLGFGLHSQTQPTSIYFIELSDSAGHNYFPNKKLKNTYSEHFIIRYNYLITENLNSKIECYYQHLFNVPVSPDYPEKSLINFGYDDNIFEQISYVNKGFANNYGVELTLEKYFSKSYYFLITGSIYNSKYTDLNGIERNSKYNCNYAWNILAGKEFKVLKNNIFGISSKVVNIGGQYYSPIDLEKSNFYNATMYYDSLAYTEKYPSFFKIDIKVKFRHNAKKYSQELSVEIGNLLNRKNIEKAYFDVDTKQIRYSYLLSRIPVVFYRIEF